MNKALSVEERLAMTLHYLSQGSSMQTIAWKYHVGKTTVHCVETCEAICTVLEDTYLKAPNSQNEWLEIAAGFRERWKFSNCLGALDGKHIKIKAPKNSGSLYFNYMKTSSIVLFAACVAHYRFTVVDIGGYGSSSDGGVLKDTIFGDCLEEDAMGIPNRAHIEGFTSDIMFPYAFVADAAFPLSEHIWRPYPGILLSDVKENFNIRLSRARRLIENAFGVLAARWRILYTTINADVALVEMITRACVCLHNLLCKPGSAYCPPGYVDTEDGDDGGWRLEMDHPLTSIRPNCRRNARHSIYSLRDELARYLHEEGRI